MKTAAVIPSKGIGDALLMMIASEQLKKAGYQVTTFHPALHELQNWFPKHQFEATFSNRPYDLVIIENDNSSKIKNLKKDIKNLSIFYPTYRSDKHFPLSALDVVFNGSQSMADNIAHGIAKLLNQTEISKDNGLTIPSSLTHQKYKKRIVIHPTSSLSEKNWNSKKYVHLAKYLKKKGFNPVFALHPTEKKLWPHPLDKDTYPEFSNLSDLAAFIYESGYLVGNDSLSGHLASNLSIPTLIIANDPNRMQLWRPGWLYGKIITPPSWLPHGKLRKTYWRHFIPLRAVLKILRKEIIR